MIPTKNVPFSDENWTGSIAKNKIEIKKKMKINSALLQYFNFEEKLTKKDSF